VLRLLRVGPEGEITIAKLDIAALLALVAALISGAGDAVRQRSAQAAHPRRRWMLSLQSRWARPAGHSGRGFYKGLPRAQY
jgi:hypothetical protein